MASPCCTFNDGLPLKRIWAFGIMFSAKSICQQQFSYLYRVLTLRRLLRVLLHPSPLAARCLQLGLRCRTPISRTALTSSAPKSGVAIKLRPGPATISSMSRT